MRRYRKSVGRRSRFSAPTGLKAAGAAIAIALVSSAGNAQPPDAFDACASTKDPAARLACFDRQVAARHAAQDRAPPAPTHVVNSDVGPSARDVAHNAQPAPSAAIVATIVKVIPRQPLISAVELDNGQIWEQSEAKPLSARPREKVTIRPGVLGSYFLKSADGRVLRVHRLK